METFLPPRASLASSRHPAREAQGPQKGLGWTSPQAPARPGQHFVTGFLGHEEQHPSLRGLGRGGAGRTQRALLLTTALRVSVIDSYHIFLQMGPLLSLDLPQL